MPIYPEHKKKISRNAWFYYEKEWLSEAQADQFFHDLLHNESWEQRSIRALGKTVTQPRLMSWAGMLPYHYSGQTLSSRPVSEPLGQMLAELSTLCQQSFNHLVLNLYRDGRDHIAMHADNEPELGPNPLIAAVSLGAPRRFVLRHKNRKFKGGKQKITLHHGSLLIMGGDFQHRWRHGIPQTKGPAGPRINITFRTLKGPPGWRPNEEENRIP